MEYSHTATTWTRAGGKNYISIDKNCINKKFSSYRCSNLRDFKDLLNCEMRHFHTCKFAQQDNGIIGGQDIVLLGQNIILKMKLWSTKKILLDIWIPGKDCWR